jgi:hypothetical protein
VKTKEALEQITYLKKIVGQTRLRLADGYPYLLIWGSIWLLGYLGSIWLIPDLLWPIIAGVGGILSVVIGVIYKRGQSVPPLLKNLGWIGLILFLAMGCMFGLLITITQKIQILHSYWPFQIGIIYLVMGVFIGRKMILIGSWLILVAMTGLWLMTPFLQIWMAVGGGGSMILSGFLLRRESVRNV